VFWWIKFIISRHFLKSPNFPCSFRPTTSHRAIAQWIRANCHRQFRPHTQPRIWVPVHVPPFRPVTTPRWASTLPIGVHSVMPTPEGMAPGVAAVRMGRMGLGRNLALANWIRPNCICCWRRVAVAIHLLPSFHPINSSRPHHFRHFLIVEWLICMWHQCRAHPIPVDRQICRLHQWGVLQIYILGWKCGSG